MMNKDEVATLETLKQELRTLKHSNTELRELLKRLCRVIKVTSICRPDKAALKSILEVTEGTERALERMTALDLERFTTKH